jgi:hypothetical protein
VSEQELPVDPDEDSLPPAIAEHPGPFKIEGIDEDGNVWEGPVDRLHIAGAFADRRRIDADDEQA